MNDFRKEAQEISTQDLLLILEDQLDLYTDEEIAILREELASRPGNALELELEEAEERAIKVAQEKNAEYLKKSFDAKINSLKAKGYEGYYEYKTLSLSDNKGGGLSPEAISQELNAYALDGWRLVTAYANELGHNSFNSGFGGFSTGTNTTKDQHILILERFVKI